MQLKPGDAVSVVAPAAQFRGADRELLNQALLLLEQWGLRPVARVEEGHHFYLAGPDRARANHLLAALSDETCKGIFYTRGGFGTSRLLPYLRDAPAPTPRLLVG